MGVKWTEEQQQVIELRDCNILVAAAAGSGKTAVLVERIITRLTKDKEPLNVDELLIVTFTEAAAAEMKERILTAIEKALEEQPKNKHLQKQATLIHNASITTIHSFCLSVIREHFHTIDLDPVFRIGEEGELKLLKQDTINKLLESKYQERSESFLHFVECVAPGKSDKNIEKMILSLYEFSRSNPQPESWLDSCVEQYHINSAIELEHSSTGKFVCDSVYNQLLELIERVERSIRIANEVGGPYHYEEALKDDEVLLQQLEELLNPSQSDATIDTIIDKNRKKISSESRLDIIYRWIHTVDWTPLSRKRPKDVDPDKKQLVQELRNHTKKVVKDWSEKYFYASPKKQVRDMKESSVLVEELIGLVKAFARLYKEEKQSRSLLDFGDMEQYALKILTTEKEEGLVPSQVASEYQGKFAEIMIDEYQDSNLVQEAILTSVSKVHSGSYNIFMVGDVKQSIYRFRLSRPELFMEKFNRYGQGESTERRIDLSKNFRSRAEVLDSTNYVFYQIMRSFLGNVEYDEKVALYCGASYAEFPQNETVSEEEKHAEAYMQEIDNRTELLILDNKEVKEAEELEDNVRELEARVVARRIKELVGSHLIYDKGIDAYRVAQYRDIVLLTRSLSGWSEVFSQVLGEEGVPTSVASSKGYFNTFEVALFLDYLRVLDNPKQDIPLAAVLRSMFGNLSDSELATVKAAYPKKTFADAIYSYIQEAPTKSEEEAQIYTKLETCLSIIEIIRNKVSYMGIQELIWEIFQETHYREYIYAMPGGEQRRANIEMLLQKAKIFEGTSYKGVFNFIRYIEELQKYEVEYGEANMVDELEDAIRIMSIHKSKGLEFPIVFVIGMGKMFNQQDLRGMVVVHPDEGIGMDAISSIDRTKSTVIKKQVIKKKLELDALGEELRILYVAMTRAKEKLILTGKISNATKILDAYRINLESSKKEELSFDFLELSKAKTYLDWILPSIYLRANSPFVIKRIELEQIVGGEIEEEIEGIQKQIQLEKINETEVYDGEYRTRLESQYEFQYPYQQEAQFKLKMSVTEIKKRVHMLEETEDVLSLEEIEAQQKKSQPSEIIEPEFMKKEQTVEIGAFRGTAYHRFMELWDFKVDYDKCNLESLLASYKSAGKMTVEMIDCIEEDVIKTFMQSDIVIRMKEAARNKNFFPEQPFVMGVPATQVYGVESEDIVLVQGIIDVYFQEGEALVVLDYKTDRVSNLEELATRYHAQLEYYGQALEKMTGKRVKEKIIYSLTLQDYIRI